MTLSLRIDRHLCGFSFPMSFCDPLTFGDASCRISCHLRFVSNSCHFCSRCIWGPFGMLRLSVCTPSRKDGIASRDSDEVGGALVPKLIDELLRSELMCLNQVVRDRFRLAYR